jgi:hypothetical protein
MYVFVNVNYVGTFPQETKGVGERGGAPYAFCVGINVSQHLFIIH